MSILAVYSRADAGMPFVREADEAVSIGPAPASASDLVVKRILTAERKIGADAIHSGCDFLAMGLKYAAKALTIKAGVLVAPCYQGANQYADHLTAEAAKIGCAVLINAVVSGGKGMRRLDRPADFAEAMESCRRQDAASFGDNCVLVEKYIQSRRRSEVLVDGDTHGNCVHLFERDCSPQRRNQWDRPE